jgi:protein AbiQ
VKYIFLTEQFYIDYAHCGEIEQKRDRPYIQIHINLNGVDFAVPLRSNITHKYVLWTDKTKRCGADFSKAVVIEDKKYIDTTTKPHIRPNEFKVLVGKEYAVRQGLIDYIEEYKKAKVNPNKHEKRRLLQYSALRYFEKYIYPKVDV